jgi:hypothetical protein
MSPFDPRPISAGGNRGIDELFARIAPEGKFRVVGLDTFDGSDWPRGDYPSLAEAKSVAADETAPQPGRGFLRYYVYDERGRCVFSAMTEDERR